MVHLVWATFPIRRSTVIFPPCREQTIAHLEQSKRIGLRNILALRGDLPPNVSVV